MNVRIHVIILFAANDFLSKLDKISINQTLKTSATFKTVFILIFAACATVQILFLTLQADCQVIPEVKKESKEKKDDWKFVISPYALLAAQATDVGTNKIRQSFSDLASLTNFGLQLFTSVKYKKWFLNADGTYANLGKEGSSGPLDLSLDIKQYILDLRLGYLILERTDDKKITKIIQGMSFEVNAGAKYWQNNVTLNYKVILRDSLPVLDDQILEEQNWWDPMIGVSGKISFSPTVRLGIYGSYGGFGIGNASKYSWDLIYINTFKITKIFLITAGFRAFKYKRTDPSPDGDIETKVTVAGPLLGVSFAF